MAGLVAGLAVAGGGCGMGAEKVAAVEPFGVVWPLAGGRTYLEIDEAAARERGALLSVEGGEWSTRAVVGRGGRVEVAYQRPGGRDAARNAPGSASGGASGGGGGGAKAGASLAYDVMGPMPGGGVHLRERRWYYDGFNEESRSLRVDPYGDMGRVGESTFEAGAAAAVPTR